MKKLLLPIFMACFSVITAQTPCAGGTAGPYPCNGIDLQSRISLADMNANDGNDSWGWEDPTTGKEYALMGLDNGTAFIDISDPINPIYLGKLPTHTNSSTWRDIKTYNDHAFIVSEANGHGMQVFDLNRLRDVTSPPVTFTEDAHFNGFGSAHNIVINEATGYAFPVGTNFYNGGPHFINIQDPLNPISEGGYSLDDYSHDAQVVTYCGPDSDYTGREILIGSNETEIAIVDITDKSNPIPISTISYSNVGYTHQGWFTEDERYFILGDELDEIDFGFNTRTLIFDFNDLDNPQFGFTYTGPTPAIDHNGYVKGTKYYMANYRAGLRILDVSNIGNDVMTEEAFFDTYPNNNNSSFSGAWSVYPYLESGNIIISDINRGFFLVRPSTAIDNTDPVAVCKTASVSLDSNGVATLAAADINDGSSDNSGTVYLLVCNNTFDCSDLGVNNVELEVYDDFGNRDFCTTQVTVIDEIAPVITCPADFSVGYDTGNSFYTVPNYATTSVVTATDNCSDFIYTQDPAPTTQLVDGVYTVSFTVEDASGNTDDCSFQLTVDSALAVNDISLQNSVSIYPNPASTSIIVDSKAELVTDIAIFDMLGNRLYVDSNLNQELNTIDISSYAKGMYFILLNNSVTKKIIKE
ncbi:choice-of-anchor B family protein [Ulvibacter antarcticus]|uniref:Choice-of-anchor B domain-containing protein n=1 Tax=Ulvibacter antarcticus TaxID=442714 RepID=A0A3L9Z133_9FLAO|nr:choice-of-anchor B family protein [Ulvibacter antarcticus]RMA65820.1 choice-of-anchor B domain-containing protein [Ulvibacter antarcticus]